MIRVTVSYAASADKRFDHDYYHGHHRALLRSLLGPHGLERVEMDRGLSDGAGSPTPVVAAAHLYFRDIDSFKAAMASSGRAVNADVANYTDIVPSVLISETLA